MNKITTLVLLIIEAVVAYFSWYFLLPTLSIGFESCYLFIGVWTVIVIATVCIIFADEDLFDYPVHVPGIAVIVFFIGLLIGAVGSSALVNSGKMHSQIGEFDNRDFKSDVLEIDTSQIPTVDIELAKKIADKTLGEQPALGSQYKIGEFTNKQQVNGKLIYVAPLEYRGVFKWVSNNDNGTPGYVVVSATNQNDVRLVMDFNGESMHLKYMNSACFSQNLRRHLKMSGYADTGLTEYSFELNEEGKPFWVVSTYKNTTWWGNPETTGVVICDPQSGECEWFSVDAVPEWVDIVQPEKMVYKQLSNYGKYVHGFWNSVFSEKDVLSVTEHIVTVYNEGDCYYYTGMSSSGSDEGTVGFVLVNTRTKAVKYYKMVGATEAAAMASAEGAITNMQYKSSEPIPLNISGIPSYFCTLKDTEGLVKAYGIVGIENYTIVATGNSIQETKRSFINKVNSAGGGVDFGDGTEAYGFELEGTVSRIGYNIENGSTYYYIIIDDDMSRLFLASYMTSEELPVTREGDSVKISYVDDSNGTINVVSFDNLDMDQKISKKQSDLDDEQEKENIINSDKSTVTEVKPEENQEIWDNLSDEERAKLLKQLDE